MELLDLVQSSVLKERQSVPYRLEQQRKQLLPILETIIDDIFKEACELLELDATAEFLYKDPNTCKRLSYSLKLYPKSTTTLQTSVIYNYEEEEQIISSKSSTTQTSSKSTSSEATNVEWSLIREFSLNDAILQIARFVETWKLTPATKFVIIDTNKVEKIERLGTRYLVEVHFSKPTPKCPNPLAVAKVYFNINVSDRLPSFYPIMVTYRFQSYNSLYYALGERKIAANTFQHYFIDSILHLKLAFYAELWECRNPLNPIEKRRKSGKQ